ncbi:hypothetical protein AJ80_08947 [Polytolypa hystricis UAMH7299]|uniref:Uncharacterized protein n=1 Tax=Polytolypa hystricis (strain UAMH7299) TaxID=1447883 RepID=A0A2B7WYX2_POLH7|nr:hypothetical protein AJ80_08947 [Polytolypa hystricis UAMH7299]
MAGHDIIGNEENRRRRYKITLAKDTEHYSPTTTSSRSSPCTPCLDESVTSYSCSSDDEYVTAPSSSSSEIPTPTSPISHREDETVPAAEVDFLLSNAELNRINDLASLRDEYEDKFRYLTEERDAIIQQKLHWQTKFVSATNARSRFRMCKVSLERENVQLRNVKCALVRDKKALRKVNDQQCQQIEALEVKAQKAKASFSAAVQLYVALCQKARAEKVEVSEEIASLRVRVEELEENSLRDAGGCCP